MEVDVDLKLYEKQTVPSVESIKKAEEARFDFSQYPRGACNLHARHAEVDDGGEDLARDNHQISEEERLL